MLAQDEIRITVDGTVILLRPTLRAAMRLERRHGGFGKIVAAIHDARFTVMADLIEECAACAPAHLLGLMRDFRGARTRGIGLTLAELAGPLLTLTFALAGIDQAAKPDAKAGDAAKITFAEFHERLFKIATGWLDWPPDTAWNATPAEILTAYSGKIDMLKAIHGTAEKATDPDKDVPLDVKMKKTFRAIGTKIVKREAA